MYIITWYNFTVKALPRNSSFYQPMLCEIKCNKMVWNLCVPESVMVATVKQYLFMVILFLDSSTVLNWTLLLRFWRYILPQCWWSTLKMGEACFTETFATQPSFTCYQHCKVGSPSTLNSHKSLKSVSSSCVLTLTRAMTC